MNLEQSLRQLKKIVPDEQAMRKSRGIILAHDPYPTPPSWATRIGSLIVENVQIATSIALTSITILLFTSGPSFLEKISPLKFASVDRSAITAEAEAVDIQIKLADLAYNEPERLTPVPALAVLAKKITAVSANETSTTTSSTIPEAFAIESPASVEEALDTLSQ
ncbi:MAG: hypothetical protein RIQ54_15 [Candidatus Parcubacteria bacterium]|jgi:hypothetical protein